MKNYKKGQTIVKKGEKLTKAIKLISGKVRVFLEMEEGREITLPFFEAMTELTTAMALSGSKSEFTFEAVGEVEAEEIEVEKLGKNEIVEAMSQSVKTAEYLAKVLGAQARGKVILAVLTASNGRKKVELTHKTIASMTGLTRETVTLQMIKLDKQKLVVNRSKLVEIADKEKLQKLILK
ncbi:Crp/Fnr family transcriptional regulator [Candidatus Shapirobacteria bacterium]|nr:Crp/Fnr family transcriptional regulator [Candidatus Shapirobacteria bacterium]